jgi:hypothetical protein
MIKKLKEKKGDGYVDVAVFILVVVLVLAAITKIVPAFIIKNQLDHFSEEALRQAQIQGKINIDCTEIADDLGISPEEVKWEADTLSGTNKVQLDQNITVEAKQKYDIGNFGPFGSFSIDLIGKASGKSEVYWKK